MKILIRSGIVLIIILLLGVYITFHREQDQAANITNGEDLQQLASITSNAEMYQDVLICENDKFQMYLYGPTLSVTIKDKESGNVLETTVAEDDGKNNAQWLGFMKSGIVIDTIANLNDKVQVDLINSESIIEINEINKGFIADVVFPKQGFALQVKVTLEENSMVVEIPDESIKETIPGVYIGAINVFPFFGYSYLGEREGYMFIPDGNGALIYLSDKEGRLSGGFSQMIYGDDIGFKDQSTQSLLWDEYQTVNSSENIIAPVFGMVHTDRQIGFLGIVEEGTQRASIEAYPNGVKVNYNRIYPRFLKRRIYVQPTNNSNTGTIQQVERDRTPYDIKVRYNFVTGDEANYSGLAVSYRNYLLNHGLISIKDNSYRTRIDFLGTEREEWLIFHKSIPMTTIKNIKEIYDDLEREGISNILSVYKGWQEGGLYNIPIRAYNADSGIGSTSELTELILDQEGTGRELYLYQDALRLNPDESNRYYQKFNIIKRVDKRLFEEETFKSVYRSFLYLTPERTRYIMEKISKDYQKKNVNRLALAGITNNIFSYSYSGKYYSRVDTMEDYSQLISKMDETFDLLLEQPFAYLWKSTEAFLDMPVGSSGYNFVDEEIPFLAMVLKGIIPMYSEYVNFEANPTEFFLQLVEMGIYPSFYITYEPSSDLVYTNSADIYSSKYSTYRDAIITYTDKLKEVNEAIDGAHIVKHKKYDKGITVVSYDNGINIYINYSNESQSIDGYMVDAMSYKVGEANE